MTSHEALQASGGASGGRPGASGDYIGAERKLRRTFWPSRGLGGWAAREVQPRSRLSGPACSPPPRFARLDTARAEPVGRGRRGTRAHPPDPAKRARSGRQPRAPSPFVLTDIPPCSTPSAFPRRSARSFISAKMIGVITSTWMVDVIMPPMMGAAIGFMMSAPTPVAYMIGTSDTSVVPTVMSFGRSRSTEPSTVASKMSCGRHAAPRAGACRAPRAGRRPSRRRSARPRRRARCSRPRRPPRSCSPSHHCSRTPPVIA